MKKKIIFSNCIFLLSLLACTNELKEETSSLNSLPLKIYLSTVIQSFNQ